MGIILDTKTFYQNNIETHVDTLNSSNYAKFLESRPTFVDYYNISTIDSTVDQGFGTLDEIVGYDSPHRYKKITNFVLHGLDKLDYNTVYSEYGLNNEVRAEAVILPNTIIPMVNDFFSIQYLTDRYIFKVESFNKDHIKDSNYYRIELVLYKIIPETDPFIISDDRVSKFYRMSYDNRTTNDYVLIEQEDFDLIDKLDKSYKELRSIYLEKYYDRRYNSLITYTDRGDIIYDPYLAEFVNTTKIFVDPLSYDCIYVEKEIYGGDYNFSSNFRKSIFGDILNGSKNFNNDGYIDYVMNKSNNIFTISSKILHVLAYYNTVLIPDATKLYEDGFTDNLKNNIDMTEGTLENVLIKYLNSRLDVDELLTLLDTMKLEDRNIKDYILTPAIIQICRIVISGLES